MRIQHFVTVLKTLTHYTVTMQKGIVSGIREVAPDIPDTLYNPNDHYPPQTRPSKLKPILHFSIIMPPTKQRSVLHAPSIFLFSWLLNAYAERDSYTAACLKGPPQSRYCLCYLGRTENKASTQTTRCHVRDSNQAPLESNSRASPSALSSS
jgi:hypothetical protein